MKSNYHQLTYAQRCQIEVLKKSFSQRKIADAIGVNQSTISRELARNTGQKGYRHNQAQQKTNQRRQGTIKPLKMTPSMVELIESKLREEWSPEQISGRFLNEKELALHGHPS
jgi:IS30 family transposase